MVNRWRVGGYHTRSSHPLQRLNLEPGKALRCGLFDFSCRALFCTVVVIACWNCEAVRSGRMEHLKRCGLVRMPSVEDLR